MVSQIMGKLSTSVQYQQLNYGRKKKAEVVKREAEGNRKVKFRHDFYVPLLTAQLLSPLTKELAQKNS